MKYLKNNLLSSFWKGTDSFCNFGVKCQMTAIIQVKYFFAKINVFLNRIHIYGNRHVKQFTFGTNSLQWCVTQHSIGLSFEIRRGINLMFLYDIETQIPAFYIIIVTSNKYDFLIPYDLKAYNVFAWHMIIQGVLLDRSKQFFFWQNQDKPKY